MTGVALIAGAGIGGLALALALARRGLASHVVERAPRLETAGAGVQLSPNASRVLDELGLGPALDAVAARPEGVSIFDGPSGRRLKRLTLGASAERRWSAPYRTLHRADLQAALTDAVARTGLVDLTLGAEIVGARQTPSGVALDIAGRDKAIVGDWLAGADGLRSTVRRFVKLPTAVESAGLIAWRVVLPAAAVPPPLGGADVTVSIGPGAHAVIYPVRGGREANVVIIGRAGASGPSEIVRNWAPPVRELAAAADDWTEWPLFDRPPDARLQRGRVTLIGDAAHAALPSLAQGAAFAIEDAAVLARLVAEGGLGAFPTYERARLRRVARLQSQARRQIRIDHMSGLAAAARNAALSLAPETALLRGLDWIYGWRDAA